MHLLNALPQRLDPGATPTFAGLISATLTSPAASNLTLGLGTGGTALTLADTTLAATFAGAVTVSSTTAGASGAGALVVAGGISAGQSAQASYFGGNVTVSKATPVVTLTNTSVSTEAQFLAQSTVSRCIIIGQFGDSSAGTTMGIANAAGSYIYTATMGVNYPNKLTIATLGRPAPIYFGTNDTLALTLDGATQAATFASAVSVSGTAATWTSGTGSPESVKTAPVGSLYTRTDGGASTTLYVKESGAGNTGWIAK